MEQDSQGLVTLVRPENDASSHVWTADGRCYSVTEGRVKVPRSSMQSLIVQGWRHADASNIIGGGAA